MNDVLAFFLIVVGLAAFVAAPLYSTAQPPATPDGATTARSDSLAAALHELEVDRASGLVDDQAYHREKAALRAEAEGLGPGSGGAD